MTFNSQAVYACADHYEELAIAAQRVMADVADYCATAREGAERRTGSADADAVVLDPDYDRTLDVYSEISDIRTAIERFRQTWIDRLERSRVHTGSTFRAGGSGLPIQSRPRAF